MEGFVDIESPAIGSRLQTGNRGNNGLRAVDPRQKSLPPTLRTLFPETIRIASRGDLSKPVSSLVTDSRRVTPGAVFFAIPGLRTHGRFYIEQAIDGGAVAVVSEEAPVHWGHTASIQVASIRRVVAQVARNYYECPDQQLHVTGITGTNGKTTVSYVLQHLFNRHFGRGGAGLIGTVQYDLGKRTIPSFKTTPEAIDTFSLLRQMAQGGCGWAVMEVSSHGIDQSRVFGLSFDVGVFLNLTQDHLDYHGDLETYYQVKKRLFKSEAGGDPQLAVINWDDPYGRRLVGELEGDLRVITFSLKDEKADLWARAYDCSHQGSRVVVQSGPESVVLSTRLPGSFNVSNILAALAVCKAYGIALSDIGPEVESFPGVPGRMERLPSTGDFNVFVDYAHTDDALANALEMLSAITRGRVVLVFGCGGCRDRDKRRLMMKVAQRYADYTCATSDNPRSESIEAIFRDMKKGVSNPDKVEFILDRRAAISRALDVARSGDTVLVAGKGHETVQEFKDRIVPFDDRQVTRELLELKQLVKAGIP